MHDSREHDDAGSFAAWLKGLLRARGISAERAALQAGLTPSTVRRWLQGRTTPRVQELDDLLNALEATAWREEVLLLLKVPRARNAVKASELSSVETTPPAFAEYRPHAGSLWRAMRQRSGLTQEAVARRLNVDASRLSRWEADNAWPLSNQRETLFALYGAAEAEREALTNENTLRGAQTLRSLVPLDNCEAHLRLLEYQVDREMPILGDLRFLTLEAALWPHATRHSAARSLFAQACNTHAEWLLRRGRFRELGTYASRAMETMPREGKACSDWLLSVGLAARQYTLGRELPDPKRAAKVLEQWLPLSIQIGCENNFYRELAQYACDAEEFSQAHALIELAKKTAERDGLKTELRLARRVEARLCLRENRAAEALRLLEEEPGSPNQQVTNALVWAEALATSDRNAAHERLQQIYDLIACHDLPQFRPDADRIARDL